jgi:hypothetical protein
VPGGVASGDGDGDEHPSGAAAGGDG